VFNRAHEKTEAWRLIVLGRNASELLVFQSDGQFRLPRIEIPAHGRVALALNAQIKALWSLAVYSLYPLPDTAPGHATDRYHVLEALQYEAVAPETAQWLPVRSATADHFIEHQDFTAIETSTRNLGRSNTNGRRSPFEKPGWFFELTDWVQEAIRPFRLMLTGNFQQFNADSSFSLIRFETNADAVWFKAVGEPNSREFSLAVALSTYLSSFTPRVLATLPQWNGWLAVEAQGSTLSQSPDFHAWEKAVASLGELQAKSIPATAEIMAAGALGIQTDWLLDQCDPFFSLMESLMQQQRKPLPPPLAPTQLLELRHQINQMLRRLANMNIPDTLCHLDCNPGNVVVSSAKCTFLDWCEAAVGNPILNFQLFLDYFRFCFASGAQAESALISAYVRSWEGLLEPHVVRNALQLAPALAVFTTAVSFVVRRDMKDMASPQTSAWLRSLARRMYREVEAASALQFVA